MVRISQASQSVNSSGEQIVEISNSSLSVSDSVAQLSLSSMDGKIVACDTSGLATSLLQGTANGYLANMDSKMVSCDTSNLATSVLQTTANGHLSSMDSKIVSCDTSGLATSLLQGTGNGYLANMDSKMVACDTSNLATSINQVTANGHLSSIDSALGGTLIVDGSGSTQPVSGTVAVSSVSGTVATSAPSVSGSNNNHLNNQTVTGAYQSSGFDVSSASRFSIMGNTTEQNQSIFVEVSPDNTNWYRINMSLYPVWTDSVSPYDFYESFEGACVNYVRLNFANYTTSHTVNATILTQ